MDSRTIDSDHAGGAAYNAGGGNVNQWLREISTEDMDLFAAQIPFSETHHYVQVVYENYRAYVRLYAP